MKKALLVIAALATGASALAQGTIAFENLDTAKNPGPGTYRIPIWVDLDRSGTRAASGEVGFGAYVAANAVGNGVAYLGLFRDAASTTPLVTAIFRTSGAGADFLTSASSGQQAVVPNAPFGSQQSLVVRAWAGNATYANRTTGVFDETTTVWTFTSSPLGGGGDPPATPPGMAGWGDQLTSAGYGVALVPEPSTIALGAIGIGALLLRRRK